MAASILFMLSCVITARFLDRRKMRAASVLYAVLFAVILCVLVFALEIPLLETAMSNVFGEGAYDELHIIALKVVNKSFYGISMITLIALSIAVQLGIAIYTALKSIVYTLVKRAPMRKFSKVYSLDRINAQDFYRVISINRLYCRMLD